MKSAGDAVLTEWIARFAPDLVLSGHIHNAPFYAEGAWVDRLGETWVFNAGRQIGQEPSHVILDLDAMTARWVSMEGVLSQDLAPHAGISAPVASAGGA